MHSFTGAPTSLPAVGCLVDVFGQKPQQLESSDYLPHHSAPKSPDPNSPLPPPGPCPASTCTAWLLHRAARFTVFDNLTTHKNHYPRAEILAETLLSVLNGRFHNLDSQNPITDSVTVLGGVNPSPFRLLQRNEKDHGGSAGKHQSLACKNVFVA
ncbi:hypothetical protein B0H65DRAFT_454704 [Neurospora tetraspora]|uniref:Uncharacterized protein n=1 Tax=Neurospora tetraspora TaxID=94610 RepID=A0AAE0MTE2_9PEZI|nr:hypothetical protein B0H65DRAFT_454704 [Neurospora tetraspora]